MVKKRKPLEEMNFQETVEHLNEIRNYFSYAQQKGFNMMVEQLRNEIETAEEHYDYLLNKEKEEYELRRRKENEEADSGDYVVFETSDGKYDDDKG